MSADGPRRAILNELQQALEIIYGITGPLRVEDFLIGQGGIAALGGKVRATEELFVLEEQGELEVGLFISPSVMERLPGLGLDGARGFLDALLPAFTTAAEGVSHFVYLTLQAIRDRAVSLLELEVQAEVDKFATALLHLWKHGERRRSGELRERLFDRVELREGLGSDERDRYQTANRLARGYAGFLERSFVERGSLEGLLRELRASYRISAAEKLAYLAAAAR